MVAKMRKRPENGDKQVEEMAPANRELTGIARRVRNATVAYNLTGSGLAALGNFIFPNGLDYGGGIWGSGFGGALGTLLSLAPRDFDYSRAKPQDSSIVMGCLNWICQTFKEAKPGVYRPGDKGQMVVDPNHKLTRLLRRPNPYYSYSKLVGVTLLDYNINGNAYWFKQKGDNGLGTTQALIYISSDQLTPWRLPGTNNFIDFYRYTVNGRVYAIPPDRLIHFRYDLDPDNPMLGRKVLRPVLSEIFGDEEAARYTAALLKNMAIPGVVIIPEEELDMSDDDAEAMKEQFKRKFSGEKVGEPWISNFRAKVQTIGFDPGKMHLKDLRRVPEERISAVLRVAAIVAGLGAGLDRSTYSNYEQAVAHSVESNLVPTWSDFGDEMTLQLLPEFEKNGDAQVRFDTSTVKALQENADAQYKRTNSIWVTNLITRAEARGALNFPVDEARDNLFYSDIKTAQALASGLGNGNGGNGNNRPSAQDAAAGKALNKALRPNLDRAFALMLSADLRQAIPATADEAKGFLQDLAEEAEKAAEDELDLEKPEEEGKRIGVKAYEAALDSLTLLFSNMGESVRPGAIRAVSLTLGIAEANAWHNYSTNRYNAAVESRQYDYGKELKEQTIRAVSEAIKLSKAGVPPEEIPARIAGFVEGRGLYPGKYQEAYDAAIAGGKSELDAILAGEKAATGYRAKVIAETEVRTLQNVATLESMQAGGVERVKVQDGDGCGWLDHEDTDKAHNSIRDLKDAKDHALAHPNCQRMFFPVDAE
jgi:HK97 family phage portal protein